MLDELGEDRVTLMADPSHRDFSVPELTALVPDGNPYPVLVVADRTTFSSDERSLLLIDVRVEHGRTLRAVPDACLSAVGNMEIDNLTFDDYLDNSGVHRISGRYRQALAELQTHHQPGTDIPSVSVAAPGASRAPLGQGFGVVGGRPFRDHLR